MKPTAAIIEELRSACTGKRRANDATASFVRMFKPRFAPLVESGKKLQTIRPLPKRIPRAGDTLSLRVWKGKPYRSTQRVLAVTTLSEIKVCCITKDAIFMQPPEGCLLAVIGAPLITLEGADADRFARDDGFNDWPEMRDWFECEHGLPFDGVILYWHKPI